MHETLSFMLHSEQQRVLIIAGSSFGYDDRHRQVSLSRCGLFLFAALRTKVYVRLGYLER